MESRVKCAVCAVAMCLVLRAGSGMEHKFRAYTDNSGLSSNTIQCLYQDDKGYVWVGTADGLDRFNSYDFTNYRSDYRRRNTLENNCIYSALRRRVPQRRPHMGRNQRRGLYLRLEGRVVRPPAHPGQRWPGAPQPAGLFACGGRRGQHVDRDARRRPLPLQPQERHVRTL